jgi:hypothetical protein
MGAENLAPTEIPSPDRPARSQSPYRLSYRGPQPIHKGTKRAEFHFQLSKYIPVAARSKAWVCGRSLAGIVGLNPAGDMDVCLL